MKLQLLRHLSDMGDDFEPADELAGTLEQNELALATRLVEAVAALQRDMPAQRDRLQNLEALIAEHRQACGELLCVEVRLSGDNAFEAGAGL